jgi:hypothetical protein
VIGSFWASDNTCEICRAGYQSSCVNLVGMEDAQAELMRIPLADGTLGAIPDMPADDLLPSFPATSDMLGTGWFGTIAAQAGPGRLSPWSERRGRSTRCAGRQAARRGANHRDEPARTAAEARLRVRRHRVRHQAGRRGVAKIKELTNGLGATQSSRPWAPRSR